MKRTTTVIVITLALSLLSVYFLYPQWSRLDFSSKPNLNLGLDLQGGMYLKMEVDMDKLPKNADGKPRISPAEAVDRALEILRNRVDSLGVAEPILQREGDRYVVVQLPGLKDPARAEAIIGQTAQLTFSLVSESVKLADLTDASGNTVASKIPDNVVVLNGKEDEGRMVLEKNVLMTGESLEDAKVDFSMDALG
jgi:protein-export membrane protein SecD